MSDLIFFFLRFRDTEPDDVLRIRPISDTQFRVTYTNGEDRTQATHLTSRDGVLGYLWTLLYILSVDIDPFRYVQISGVGFPAVMYSIGDIEPTSATWTAMFTVVSTFLDRRWTVIPMRGVVQRARSRQTAPEARNSRSSSIPQSVPDLETLPSEPGSVHPQSSEWGGEESRTTGSS